MNILWNSNSKAITMFTCATLLPTFPVGDLVLHDDVTTNVNRPMVFAPANSRKRVSDVGNVLCSAGFLHESCCQFHPFTEFPEMSLGCRDDTIERSSALDTNLLCALGARDSKLVGKQP